MERKNQIWIWVLVGAIIIGTIIIIAVKGNTKANNGSSEIKLTNEENSKTLIDGTKVNTSEMLKKTKYVNELEITNIQLTNQEGITVLLADVKNGTNADTKTIGVEVKLLDKEGKILDTVQGLIPALKSGASTQLNIGVGADYANAYDFEIVAK